MVFSEDVSNVYIFIADSTRFDSVDDLVTDLGTTYKTVSPSTFTAPSLPSLLTGCSPLRHGVFCFENRLHADVTSIFDRKDITTGYHSPTVWIDGPNPLHDILNINRERSLEELSPPFISIEHDKGGHCPYGSLFNEYDGDCADSFHEQGGNGRLAELYSRSIDNTVDRFLDRLSYLASEGLLDETLVVFTSDHGELLGEYGGLVGHGTPMCPELIYVPTVFIHPDIPKGKAASAPISSLDILPTVLSSLDLDYGSVDGDVVTARDESDVYTSHVVNYLTDKATNLKERVKNRAYVATGIWEKSGGYVFQESNILKRMVYSSYLNLVGGNTARYNHGRRPSPIDVGRMVRYYLAGSHSFGCPQTTKADARDHVPTEYEGVVNRQLSNDVEARLADLGYR